MGTIRDCVQCGQPFESSYPDAVLCGDACRKTRLREQQKVANAKRKTPKISTLQCQRCSTTFTAKKSFAQYCSTKCRDARPPPLIHIKSADDPRLAELIASGVLRIGKPTFPRRAVARPGFMFSGSFARTDDDDEAAMSPAASDDGVYKIDVRRFPRRAALRRAFENYDPTWLERVDPDLNLGTPGFHSGLGRPRRS